jgi:hypothetical protein
MIKREGKILKYALVRNHLQIMSDLRASLGTKAIFMFSKSYKTQVSEHDCSKKI